jgi:AcrR family transcriptional regulator
MTEPGTGSRTPRAGRVASLRAVRPEPRTTKGRRTRKALVDAARVVFERDGFLGARVSDMTALAEVSHGSFYSYFDTKEEIFWTVLNDVTVDMFDNMSTRPLAVPRTATSLQESIEQANQQFIDSFRRNAAMIRVLEEVATYNDDFRELRREVRHRFIERIARSFKQHQARGAVSPSVDAEYAAHALGAMMDRFCYAWFVLEEDFDEARALAELNRIWLSTLGLAPADRSVT